MNRLYLLPAILILLLGGCLSEHKETQKSTRAEAYDSASFVRPWAEIIKSDTLIVGTVTSPTDFFVYRNERFGAEYQKVLSFAEAHDLELDIRITQSPDSLLGWISDGEIDLSITPFAFSRENTEKYAFLGMNDTLSLVLVQNKAGKTITSLPDLHNHTLTVVPNSVSELRAMQIVEELGDTTVRISRVDTLGQEDLLEYIATHRDSSLLTLAESDLARIYAGQYPDLVVSTKASLPIRYGWIAHKTNTALKDSIDSYFSDSLRIAHFQRLALLNSAYAYYFDKGSQKTYRLLPGGISPYDALFQKEAKRLGWHWTFLASIAAQESTFRADVVAWSGASGLMGIMPSTGRNFGASPEDLLDPEVSVRVAVDLLLSLKPLFSDIPGEEAQEAFVLAAYNAGIGHVQDAQRLAEKYGSDPKKWYGGVREYMLLKSSPKYYNDPVVRFGYVRGRETVDYVDEITHRAEAYRQHIK